MSPLARETTTPQFETAPTQPIANLVAGHDLITDMVAANDTQPVKSKNLVARRRKRWARRSVR